MALATVKVWRWAWAAAGTAARDAASARAIQAAFARGRAGGRFLDMGSSFGGSLKSSASGGVFQEGVSGKACPAPGAAILY